MVLVSPPACGRPARAALVGVRACCYVLGEAVLGEAVLGEAVGERGAEWMQRGALPGRASLCTASFCPAVVLLACSLAGCMRCGSPEPGRRRAGGGSCGAVQRCTSAAGRRPLVAGRGTMTGGTSLPAAMCLVQPCAACRAGHDGCLSTCLHRLPPAWVCLSQVLNGHRRLQWPICTGCVLACPACLWYLSLISERWPFLA